MQTKSKQAHIQLKERGEHTECGPPLLTRFEDMHLLFAKNSEKWSLCELFTL